MSDETKAILMNKDVIEEELRTLKSEYFTSQNSTFSKNEFDIFGSMKDDSTKVRYLNNKSHRENEKDKFQVLSVNKKIDIFDFTEKLQLITSSLAESMHKINCDYDMPIYQVASINEKLHKNDFIRRFYEGISRLFGNHSDLARSKGCYDALF